MKQTQTLNEFLTQLEEGLPPLCTARDLVRFGIVGSESSVNRLRSEGNSPSYFRIGNKSFRYLKADVISWVESKYHQAGVGNGASV